MTKIAIDKQAREEKNKGYEESSAGVLPASGRLRGEEAAECVDRTSDTKRAATTHCRIIEHCVVVKQENTNTVTCSCLPVNTVIDSKTRHTALVCKKMKEEK